MHSHVKIPSEMFCGDNEIVEDGECKKQGNLGDGCKSEADILFLIDGSGSVRASNFVKVKNTLKRTIRMFQLGAGRTHVGVVQFSSNVRVSNDPFSMSSTLHVP